MTSQENVHVTNRDKLVDFLIADLAGPSTRSSFVEFEELDTSKEELTFKNKEDAWKCFVDINTREEVLSRLEIDMMDTTNRVLNLAGERDVRFRDAAYILALEKLERAFEKK